MARRRGGRRGRPPKPLIVRWTPQVRSFLPFPQGFGEPVQLDHAEVEALRLVDLEGLSQEEAGNMMGTSRGTVWRLLQSARRKVAEALTQGRAIIVV
ncbi:DUF134 domain-containing protein [Candidatus Bathyarchaeota archaeon]|nr:MAG: DUF134 domain-containing protein [Candidatus Bathyarchaeota archaeon]